MSHIAATGAAGVVNDLRLGRCGDAQASPPEPGTDVDVFVVQVVAFVEPANALKRLAAEKHEHAGYPIGVEDRLAGVVWVTSFFSPECLGKKGGEGRESAQVVFDFPIGGEDDRRGDSGVRTFQRQEEGRKGIPFDRYVWVKHAKVRGVSQF